MMKDLLQKGLVGPPFSEDVWGPKDTHNSREGGRGVGVFLGVATPGHDRTRVVPGEGCLSTRTYGDVFWG